MLQSFRDNTQSIVVKIIVGFIIITFALFGVDSLIGLTGQPNAPITVNGVDISEQQIAEGIDLQRRQILAQMGDNADPTLLDDNLLRAGVVENLIERELLRQAAEEQGLRISEQYLDSAIVSTREFQVDGTFDRNQFEAMLRNVGMTPLMYRDYLRNETLLAQRRNAIIASAFVLPQEAQRVAELDRQTRSFKYLEISIADLLDRTSVTEAEIQAYYDKQRASFRSQEQISLEYVELSKSDLASTIEVDEAELRSQYERLVAGFEAEEVRDAAHILLLVDDSRSESEALDLSLELRKQLDAGADFADLAREHSEDPGSADDGGNLGIVEKGVMVPEFEEGLFDLSEGQISQPVRTEFGYHLIKLNAIERPQPPSFEQARERLAEEQRLQRAEALFVEQTEELDDLRFSSSDLQEASEVLGLEIKSTGFFGRDGGETPLTQSPRLLAAAFSNDVLSGAENSAPIELGADRVVVVHLKEHRPERTLELDEVRPRIVAELKRQQASAQVMSEAQSLLQKAQQQGLDAVAGDGNSWQAFNDIGRASPEVTQEVKSALFKMPKPADGEVAFSLVELADGSAAVLALERVGSGAESLDEQQRKGLSDFLANRLGQTDYRDQLNNLKASADIQRL